MTDDLTVLPYLLSTQQVNLTVRTRIRNSGSINNIVLQISPKCIERKEFFQEEKFVSTALLHFDRNMDPQLSLQ